MNKRISPEHREIAAAIRVRITEARRAKTAAVLHYRTFERPSPGAPRGVMVDLTVPDAMAANQALGTTGRAVQVAEADVTRKCPEAERQACARCAGSGIVWRHSNVAGGVCFACNGRKWRPRDRWVRACMPDPNQEPAP